MILQGKVAVATGAARGIGAAVAVEFARRGAKAVGLVNMMPDPREPEYEALKRSFEMTRAAVEKLGAKARVFVGDVTDEAFRVSVFDQLVEEFEEAPHILVPAAGITDDDLAVRVDKTTGKATLYRQDRFEKVLRVNLIAPTYWALEMIGRIAEARATKGLKKWTPQEGIKGVVVFIGSISSLGNMGQVSYAATKAALAAVATTLCMEDISKYGVRAAVVHPGFVRTAMVEKIPPDVLEKLLASTRLGRLIEPEEIAGIIANVAEDDVVSDNIWADAGYHPLA